MTRREFTEKAKAQLELWEAKIDEAEARAKAASAEAEAAYREQLQEMRVQRDMARQRIDDLEHASEEAWGDVMAGLQAAWDRLEHSFETSRRRFG